MYVCLSELLLEVNPHSGIFALSELLLGVSPHSGLCVHEWVVARSFLGPWCSQRSCHRCSLTILKSGFYVRLVCVCMGILPTSRLKCISGGDGENVVRKNLILKHCSQVTNLYKIYYSVGCVLLTLQGGFTLPEKWQTIIYWFKWHMCAV